MNCYLFRYVGAGHPPALLWCGGRNTLLESTGFPVGLEPNSDWEMAEAALPPGAVLLLYTDGVLDAPNPNGALFGRGRLIRQLEIHASAGKTAQEIVDALTSDVQAWVTPEKQMSDDILLVAVRRLNPTPSTISAPAVRG